MFKKLLLLLFVSICFESYAQDIQGVVTYNRKTDWIAINSELPWMTSEDIDRDKLTWGNYERKGTNYELHFKNKKSTYSAKKELSDSGYSWKQNKFLLIRDYKKKTTNDWIETLDKKFIVKDKMPKYKWKILNEIKEVEGYLCMKAETKDTIKNQTIVAWFTDRIPFYGGPEGYSGLPGLILELNINDGASIVTATDVDLEIESFDFPIPKKMKGKEISKQEFDDKIAKYIKNSYEGEKNPFWRIRY